MIVISYIELQKSLCSSPSLASVVLDQTSSGPHEGVVTLIPIDSNVIVSLRKWLLKQNDSTYTDFLPANLGCVAQDPPSTMLCFSS